MDIDEALMDCEDRMIKTVVDYDGFVKSVRTGQATTEILDKVSVDIPAYGGVVPLKSVAVVAKQDATLVVVKPFDIKTIKDIEKALSASDIGITPTNDGKVIRIAFPPMSEERRKQTVKILKDRLEQHKVALRNIRKESLKHIEDSEGKAGISEDMLEKGKEEIQSLTKQHEDQLDKHFDNKSVEVMKV